MIYLIMHNIITIYSRINEVKTVGHSCAWVYYCYGYQYFDKNNNIIFIVLVLSRYIETSRYLNFFQTRIFYYIIFVYTLYDIV